MVLGTSFAELDGALRAEGYAPRAPSAEVVAQDEWTCVRLVCPGCSRPDLAYRPYLGHRGRRNGRAEYRPLAVCPRCGDALEF
jgi:hypothetical protein